MAFLVSSAPFVQKRVRHDSSRSLRMSNGSPDARQARVSRRDFARLLQAAILAPAGMSLLPKRASALSGLKIFPLTEQLGNNYFLMRAGECKFDSRGQAKSNPIDMMSVNESGLTRRGIDQTRKAAEALREKGVEFDAWVWAAIATNSMETAEVLAYELNIRRERVIPEFSFLDPRGLGVLDGKPVHEVRTTLAEMDRANTEAKPEPHHDGTPNESVEQVFVKVRQLVSKIETQYFGENIVIIAPDSQPLSILQAALTDVDLGMHHELAFSPGELRRVEGRVVSPIDGSEQIRPFVEVIHKSIA